MAVFSSISDTGYDTVITTLGQQDLRNAVCHVVEEKGHTVKFQIEDALLLNFSNFGARFYSKISKFYVVKFL